ncbi:MAG: hypothetical protein LQ343_004409 [Gyalolechia ehrenbergii]|nr:MAG: hypothetical protein LQ343_004409 [Gyalolechia ehrenbergii]
MASPTKSPPQNKSSNSPGKSVLRTQTSAAASVSVSDPNLPADIQSSMQAFLEIIVATAVEQTRYESLNHDERQQRDEQTRWAGYYDSFVSLSEDQTRNLKATQSSKGQSEKQLNQAMQKGEQAAQRIAQCLSAASRPAPATEHDVVVKRLERKLLSQSEEIEFLKKEVSALKRSAVEIKSNYHHVDEIADTQHRQEQELSELQKTTVRKSTYRECEAKYDKKISELVAQSKVFTTFTSKQDKINKDLSRFQASQVASKSEFKTELRELKNGFDKNKCSHEATLATLKRVEDGLITSKRDTVVLQEFKSRIEKTTDDLEERLQHINGIQSTEKSLLEQLNKRFTNDVSEMTEYAHTTCQKSQEITKTCSADHQKLRDELEALKAHLNSTEQMHNDRTRNQSDIASYIEDSRQLRAEQQAQKAQLDSVTHTLEEYGQAQSGGTGNAQSVEVQTISRQEFEELSVRVDAMKDREDQRDEQVGNAIDRFEDTLTKETKEFKDQKAVLASFQSRLDDQGNYMIRISTDQSSNNESLKDVKAEIVEVRSEVVALKESNRAVREESGDQQSFITRLQSEISDLGHQINMTMQKSSQPSPPPPVCGMKDEVQPKIEALETLVQDLQNSKDGLTDKVRAVETFQATYESRWNNLTTESLVNGVLLHLQRPLHMLQNDLNQVKQQQNKFDIRMLQLNDSVNKNHDGVTQGLGRIEKVAGEARDRSHTALTAVEAIECRVNLIQQSLQQNSVQLEKIDSQNKVMPPQAFSPISENQDEVKALKGKYDVAMTTMREIKDEHASDRAKFNSAVTENERIREMLMQAYRMQDKDPTMVAVQDIKKKLEKRKANYDAAINAIRDEQSSSNARIDAVITDNQAIGEKLKLLELKTNPAIATIDEIREGQGSLEAKLDGLIADNKTSEVQVREMGQKVDSTLVVIQEIKEEQISLKTKPDGAIANHQGNWGSYSGPKSGPEPTAFLAEYLPTVDNPDIKGKLRSMFETEPDAAIAGKSEVNEKLRSIQMTPDTSNVAIQILRGLVQSNQTDTNGKFLGLQAEYAKLEEKVNTDREEIMAEMKKLCQMVEATNTCNNDGTQRKVAEVHTEVSKLQDKGSDSDAPIVRPGKRSQPRRSDSAKKKRKLNPYTFGSGDESYTERSTPKSARSKKKSYDAGGGDEYAYVETDSSRPPHTTGKSTSNVLQPQADKPSPRKGRPPKKTAPTD